MVVLAIPLAKAAMAMLVGVVNWGHIGMMENNMENTIVDWVYVGIMKIKWKLP